MKGFLLVLLGVIAAVQGRNFVSQENAVSVPWLVHLRIARPSSGFLDSCVGTLYTNRHVITAASCLVEYTRDIRVYSRYFWVRYDTQNIIQPGYVTEATKSQAHPIYSPETGVHNIGFVELDREIQFSDRIQPLGLAPNGTPAPSSGKVCGYGEKDGNTGEVLQCMEVTVSEYNGFLVSKSDGKTSKYDFGAALVSDNMVHGILVREADSTFSGIFLATAKYASWLEEAVAPGEPRSGGSFADKEEILVGEPVNVAEEVF
ncbi:unnamed protein product [Leptosia nina]|uniref:Peptidase S1 domain-containing protein n=1 Tax=Leptosia nina TaxID=320188 RepID=A0AAV1J1F1_9NEOP